MLVAMSLFLIFATVSLGIYTSTVRAQRKTLSLTRVQQEAQFITEFLGKKIRTSDIDYAAYPGDTIPSPTTQLILLDADNNQYDFTYDNVLKAVMVSVNGTAIRRVSGTSVAITDINYFVTPSMTPFPGGGAPPTDQPRATIVMRFSSTAGGQGADILVQQTVPQRSVGF